MVLHFAFRSMIYFELIFVKGVGSVSRFLSFFFFFCIECSVSALFVEETVFAPSYCLCSFCQRSTNYIYGGSFWALCSVPLVYLSIFILPYYSLDYCSFTVSLEVWQY